MTLPPVIRVFFAIDLPAAFKEKMGDFISTLKKKSRNHNIRWTKSANLHITLQFLAETKTEDLENLIRNVREKIPEMAKRPLLQFGALHLFPNPYRPRVIVLEVLPQEHLAVLSGLIGEGIKATHYEIDERPFRAHLTLGRIKQPKGLKPGFLSGCDVPDFESLTVEEVVLFRSEPKPEGSEYTVMEKLKLE